MQLSIKFQSDRSYLASWQNKIIARYELLKTRPEARLKSVYLGAKSMSEAQNIAKTVNSLFAVRVEIRPAQRCKTAFEVVVRGIKIALMPELERFIRELIEATERFFPTPKPVAPFQPIAPMRVTPLIRRPDQPDRALVKSGGLRLNIL